MGQLFISDCKRPGTGGGDVFSTSAHYTTLAPRAMPGIFFTFVSPSARKAAMVTRPRRTVHGESEVRARIRPYLSIRRVRTDIAGRALSLAQCCFLRGRGPMDHGRGGHTCTLGSRSPFHQRARFTHHTECDVSFFFSFEIRM